PADMRRAQIREQRTRYRQVSIKENALKGFAAGLVELRRTIRAQKRTPLTRQLFDRFTGLAYAREALQSAFNQKPFRTVQLVDEGKNGWVVRKALAELGVAVQDSGLRTKDSGPDCLVIGTMSPGPMLDSFERRTLLSPAGSHQRILAPWTAITRKPAA